MPSTNYPGVNPINFRLTTGALGGNTQAIITHSDGSTSTYARATGVALSYQVASGTTPIVSALGTTHYFDVPTVTQTYTIAVALLGTTVIHVGGTSIINNAVSALSNLQIDVAGGSATYNVLASAASSAAVTIEDGGTFATGTSLLALLAGTTITYGVNGGTFVTGTDPGFINIGILSGLTINGFDTTGKDKIDDKAISAGSVNSYSIASDGGSGQLISFFSGVGGTGTLQGTIDVSGTHLLQGTFGAAQANGALVLSNDGTGALEFAVGTLCFLTGTNIATPEGEVAVEKLRIGDLVLTDDGRSVPVRWMGRNTVASRFADPLRFMPIRMKAGALGDQLPVRDLLVSPDHAMFVDGILIQASALVNGLSIVRESDMPATFVYYHIEVEGHSLVRAEGALAETFVDNAGRMAFDNWDEYLAIFGAEENVAEMDYPRAQSARQVPASIRARLSDRADSMLGWSLAHAA
jgi:hypothetical protein